MRRRQSDPSPEAIAITLLWVLFTVFTLAHLGSQTPPEEYSPMPHAKPDSP